jgi:UDP-galactopyranose mutase
MQQYDVIVVGAGFAGATIAREKAEQGKKVLVVDKRNHIGGNMYEKDDSNGVRIHLYGPHIFHTNNKEVFEYLKKFSGFFLYEHKVLGKINNKLVPIPFNYTSLEMLYEKKIADEIKENVEKEFPLSKKISILDLINSENKIVKEFGEFVYKNVFENYTAKQWGTTIDKIDKSVINRVPVVLGYDDRYFNDEYQYMPINGFTEIFENMLNHENITIELNTNIKEKICLDFQNSKVLFENQEFLGEIYYTGAIDELLNYKYGLLPYRTLELKFEQYNCDNYQPNSVVNYPNDEDFTRITEFKYLTRQEVKDNTTILKEFSAQYDINNEKFADPYYPITNDENLELYNKYKKDLESFNNIILCGRLAEYKYYNMDAVIGRSLEISKKR